MKDDERMTGETGFVPGKGSAYDYLPKWMNVPKLYETEGQEDPLAVVKLFHPLSDWTWYVVESDGDRCFGLVDGNFVEKGYFSLAEMREFRLLGLRIERDVWFEPRPLSSIETRGL